MVLAPLLFKETAMPRLKLISRSKHDKDNEEKKIYIHGTF